MSTTNHTQSPASAPEPSPFASSIRIKSDFERLVVNNALVHYARSCEQAAPKEKDPTAKLSLYETAHNVREIIKRNRLASEIL